MTHATRKFVTQKNLPPKRRWQGKFQARGSYFPKKKSANAFAFGVPTPVTLSQPAFVCRPLSVPNETTAAVSSKVKMSHIALTNELVLGQVRRSQLLRSVFGGAVRVLNRSGHVSLRSNRPDSSLGQCRSHKNKRTGRMLPKGKERFSRDCSRLLLVPGAGAVSRSQAQRGADGESRIA